MKGDDKRLHAIRHSEQSEESRKQEILLRLRRTFFNYLLSYQNFGGILHHFHFYRNSKTSPQMKALLLRVGIDKGTGGCLAPIFEDGLFEYIPIPEGSWISKGRTYADIFRNSRRLLNYLPTRLHRSIAHLDPEFETFTYGDPTRNKRSQLAGLVPGDLLIFYAGLEPQDGLDKSKLFIVGYFTVRQIYDFYKIPESEHTSLLQKLRNNAHSRRKYPDKRLVIVKGNPKGSSLLSKAIPLGDARNCILPDLERITGYEGSLLRAIGHWIDKEHASKVKQWLDDGIPILVEQTNHLFSYVLASDTGFAPNISGGYCTLACCKPKVRGSARVGDWIMGTLPRSLGRSKLGFIMRVNEILSFNDYYKDPRFKNKRPSFDPNGDNIYRFENGKYVQAKSKHHNEKDLKHDTQVDSVLISSLFWYFGNKAPEMPVKFLQSLIKTGPGHKRIREPHLIRDFVSWVSSKYRPSVLGNPRDNHNSTSDLREIVCRVR